MKPGPVKGWGWRCKHQEKQHGKKQKSLQPWPFRSHHGITCELRGPTCNWINDLRIRMFYKEWNPLEPGLTLAWRLAGYQRLRPETLGISSPPLRYSVQSSNRLRPPLLGINGSDFYSKHIYLCLGKGKHEIYFTEKLKSMEGKLIFTEENHGGTT